MTGEGRRRIVVDASVALKWQLNDEDHLGQALALRDDWARRRRVSIDAPTLFVYELINGVHSAVRTRRVSPDDAAAALDNLLAIRVPLHEPEPQRVLALAREHQLAAYDAAYLDLAQRLGADLYTADRPFHSACKDLAYVHWIADYPR